MERNPNLERHRWRHRLNGFPIYGDWEDYEEDVVIGYISEPLWKWADMDEADKATVLAEAASYRADPRGAGWSEDEAFYFALGEYAVACPHLRWTYHEPIWRECKACRAAEQLPGRVVYIDDKPMRVSDPPPQRLRIPKPVELTFSAAASTDPMVPNLQIDEYEWCGHGYRKINA